jgi:hypothetical protein
MLLPLVILKYHSEMNSLSRHFITHDSYPVRLLTIIPLLSVGDLLKFLGSQFPSGKSTLSAGLCLALRYKMVGGPVRISTLCGRIIVEIYLNRAQRNAKVSTLQLLWSFRESVLRIIGWLGALSVLHKRVSVICKGDKIGMLSLTLG